MWHLDGRRKGSFLVLSGDRYAATKKGNKCNSESSIVGSAAMMTGIHRWRCTITTTNNSWALFGVSNGVPQDECCFQNPQVRGWTTTNCRAVGGPLQSGSCFYSSGEMTVDLELHCDPVSKSASLTATAVHSSASETLRGISLPVFPFFVLPSPGSSITIDAISSCKTLPLVHPIN